MFQIAYIFIQSRLTSYNAIYGSFAAVPLFLIWLQSSWQIVLFGAELSFAYQNIRKFEFEKIAKEMSYEYRKKALLVVMHQIIAHFLARDGAVSSETVAQDLNLPVRIVRDAVFDLEKAGLIVSTVSKPVRAGPRRAYAAGLRRDPAGRGERNGVARFAAESRVPADRRDREPAEPDGQSQRGQCFTDGCTNGIKIFTAGTE